MGPETLIPLLVSGGGALLQMSARQDAADQKRSILNRQLERDDQAQKKAIGLVQQEGQKYGIDERLKAMQAQEDQTYAQTQADIQGAGGASVNTAGDAGSVSEDFLKGKAERAATEGARLTSIAREAAKTRAPGSLMSDDALRRAGMAGDLQNTWGINNNMARATGIDADGVQEPGYGAFGSIASAIAPAIGSAMSKGAGVSWDPDGSYARKYARDPSLGMGR